MTPRWESRFELKPGSWVFVPSPESIQFGLEVKHQIEERWRPPSHYYHLHPGGHIAALQAHLSSSTFVHLDIRDFFGCINRSRVTRVLKRMFGYDRAREIANASTVIHPDREPRQYILPFGFVQSPLLASISLQQSALGACLQRLKKLPGIRVSVYVDDIILSSASDSFDAGLLDEVKVSATRSGFALNDSKEEGPAASIAAFNIELANGKLKITEARWQEFASEFIGATSEHQRRGILGYLGTVNMEQRFALEALEASERSA